LRQEALLSGSDRRHGMREFAACRRLEALEMARVAGGGKPRGGLSQLPAEALAHLNAEILCVLFPAPLMSTVLCG